MPKHTIKLPDGVKHYLPPCHNCELTMHREVTPKGEYFACECGTRCKVPALFLIGGCKCGDIIALTEAATCPHEDGGPDWILNQCKPCYTGTKDE